MEAWIQSFETIILILKCIKGSKLCPLECESNTFDLYLSSSDYPTESLFEIQKKNKEFTKKYSNNTKITFERVRRSSIAMNIYYPHLKYTALTELEKITIIDLLAGIGGTFGERLFKKKLRFNW